jgi:hypothetical protein
MLSERSKLSESAWLEKAASCPHVKSEVPAATAAISGFHTEEGYLHRNFFDPSSSEKLSWSLESCLTWANPEVWMHTPSGTLEGGPYGIKWPVLLLLHIRLNMMALQGLASGAGGIRKPDYYETLRPQFSPREEGLWLLAAHTIGTALLKSTKTLMSSAAE